MGKKVKVGAQRKDKYYKLAKETGYRSRASFKLVQLNRKFEFLHRSKVLVDLCAAPGGWLQVAAQYMPVSRLVIGVDLVPIRPINGTITLQGDITHDKTLQNIKRELKTWDVDCVLNDGAPNVGKNWLHDAFSQAQLTLSALKLATNVLRKGGWFVTKVFRSKDYPALLTVFGKLFRKVHATKPQASRNESAEIFVVCQHYLKPVTVDPQLLDPKAVFKDLNLEPEKPKLNLLHPEKKRKRAVGYAEGDNILFHRVLASDFMENERFLELLAEANEIVVDSDEFKSVPEYNTELCECLKDIKVLGRKELRLILNWRKSFRKSMFEKMDADVGDTNQAPEEEDQEALIESEIAEAKMEEKSKTKRQKRKAQKEKKKRKDKLDLKMVIPGDKPDIPDQQDLFNLRSIRSSKHLKSVVDTAATGAIIHEEEKEDVDNPLLVDENTGLDKKEKQKRRTEQWFDKDVFAGLETEQDEDEAVELFLSKMDKQKGTKRVRDDSIATPIESESPGAGGAFQDEKDDFFDSDGEETSADKQGFEIVKADGTPKKKKIKLDAEGMALGEQLIYSSKTRRDAIENGYHRFVNNDTNLPDWFASDERRHYRKQMPVSKEAVAEYAAKLKELNARPIKKVAEAKMRKRKRSMAKMSKAKKKAENIVENPDLSVQQKSRELQRAYRSLRKKPDIQYTVVTKGNKGKRTRPKGPYKAVDRRLKKDTRKMKQQTKGDNKNFKVKPRKQKEKEQRRSAKKRKGKR